MSDHADAVRLVMPNLRDGADEEVLAAYAALDALVRERDEALERERFAIERGYAAQEKRLAAEVRVEQLEAALRDILDKPLPSAEDHRAWDLQEIARAALASSGSEGDSAPPPRNPGENYFSLRPRKSGSEGDSDV